MKPEVSKRKQVAGLLYGLAAGLAFAIFTWGVDSLLLAHAHGAFPWVKFVPGLFTCVFCGGLTGWLTIRLQRIWLGIILWAAQALLFAHLVMWLPIRVAPVIIKIFNPALGEFLKYPYYAELNQNLWFGFAMVAIVSIICGLLESILIDQALFSSGNYTITVPLVVCFLAFSLAGNSADALMNKVFREPIQIVDRLIDFAWEYRDKDAPIEEALDMRLATLNSVKDWITEDRKIVLSNFDQYMSQVEVLLDFEGKWVKCTTIYNQVTNCKKVNEMPWIRLSNIVKLAGMPSYNTLMQIQ
jgi:hypothetical protein